MKSTLLLLFFLAFAFAQDDAFAEAEDAADDFADDVEDDFEEAEGDLREAAEDFESDTDAVIDDATDAATDAAADGAAKVTATGVQTLAEQMEEEEMWVLLIGIVSIIDTIWWLVWGWFVYIDTNVQDSTMCVNSDCAVKKIPISWFWESLSHSTLSWTALQYLWIWLFYMLISVPEMIFWAMHMAGEPKIGTYLFNIWVQYPGLYGSWILYFFTFLWPIIQLTALTGINQPGYTNAAVQLAMFTVTWLLTGIVHVLGYPFVQRMYERTLEPVEEVAAEPVEVVEPEDVEEEEEEEEEELDDDDDSDDAF